jgi:hypothetical protein
MAISEKLISASIERPVRRIHLLATVFTRFSRAATPNYILSQIVTTTAHTVHILLTLVEFSDRGTTDRHYGAPIWSPLALEGVQRTV